MFVSGSFLYICTLIYFFCIVVVSRCSIIVER